jgi:hypothetical protein
VGEEYASGGNSPEGLRDKRKLYLFDRTASNQVLFLYKARCRNGKNEMGSLSLGWGVRDPSLYATQRSLDLLW